MKTCLLIVFCLCGYGLGKDVKNKCPSPQHMPLHPSMPPRSTDGTPPHSSGDGSSPKPPKPTPSPCRTDEHCTKNEMCCPHFNHSICIPIKDFHKTEEKHTDGGKEKHFYGIIGGLSALIVAAAVVGMGTGFYFWRRHKRNQMNKRACRATIEEANATSKFQPTFGTYQTPDSRYSIPEEKPNVM